MSGDGNGRQLANMIGMLAQASWQKLRELNARLVSFVFDAPDKQYCCPECGGTDLFDGRGTCQICQPM